MASRIQIRRDTAANWSANNPTLASGEIAFVTDENKVKVGDGSNAWNSLAYLEADAYLDSVVMGDDTTGDYVETLVASDGISISGEGQESASVTVTNTGVLSLAGTTNEVEVSASSGNITLSLPTSITVDLVGDVTGNADTASTLATPRNISLDGDVSGSASFDGGSNISITATVADDSHNHTVSNVDGLQNDLDAKAPLSSPALTGTPTAPTAASATNSTQIATTAFVQTAVSNLIDGAPGALDTLNELAASLGDDADFAGTVTNSLAGKQPLDADLTAIAGLAGTSGLLKKDAADTWSLDTNTYLTGNETITVSGDATGSGTTSISLTLANSGVSASTYGGSTDVPVITVDAKGRVTNVTTSAIVSLPDQSGNSGKYLTTDGTNASWDVIDLSAYQPLDGDLTAIAALAGTSGFLKKTAANTWSLDTNNYLTGNQTITLTGDASGSGTTSISVTVADDSHNHVISNVDGLQTALNGKASTSSPTFSGTITVGSDVIPNADNSGNVGTSSRTWNNGRFTNLTVDSTLSVRAAIDLADNDHIRFGSSDDARIFYDGSNNDLEIELEGACDSLRITDNGTHRIVMNKTGHMTVVSEDSANVRGVRNTYHSTSAPSGGSNGDIWLQYS